MRKKLEPLSGLGSTCPPLLIAGNAAQHCNGTFPLSHLMRASSAEVMPMNPTMLERLDSLNNEGKANGSLEGARRRKHVSAGTQSQLARAVEALTDRIEGLGKHFQTERQAAEAREAALVKLLSSLSARLAQTDKLSLQSSSLRNTLAAPVAQETRVITQIESHLWQQRSFFESEAAARQSLCSEQSREARAQTEALTKLVQAVQLLEVPRVAPVALEEHHLKPLPRYRPYIGRDSRLYEFPEVQIGVKIYQVCNVNTSQMTFEVDFVCHLDWLDPNVEGIASEQLPSLEWGQYFNPRVEIDNGKDSCVWMLGADEIPRRKGHGNRGSLCSSKSEDAGGEMGPWLRKTMRFRGTLALSSVNLRCFPYDIQVLPIKLKAARCRGLTLGTPLFDLRKQEQVHRIRLVDNGTLKNDCAYLKSALNMRSNGHFAVPAADDSLLEFNIAGLHGCHAEKDRSDTYEIRILVERPLFASYFFDLVIMNLLVALSATAMWDTAAPELSSRMSISLTVILTLAAYTSARPAPIEKAPYVTFHDWCEQVCMFLVAGISMQNVYAVVLCGGQHEEAPPYMKDIYEDNEDACSMGWCFSRKVDCRGFIILLTAWFALSFYSFLWLIRTRRASKGFWHRLLSASCCRAQAVGDDEDDGTEAGRRSCWQRLCCVCCCGRSCGPCGSAQSARQTSAAVEEFQKASCPGRFNISDTDLPSPRPVRRFSSPGMYNAFSSPVHKPNGALEQCGCHHVGRPRPQELVSECFNTTGGSITQQWGHLPPQVESPKPNFTLNTPPSDAVEKMSPASSPSSDTLPSQSSESQQTIVQGGAVRDYQQLCD